MKRKFLSMVVILAMLLSMMPFSAMTTHAIEAVTLDIADGSIVIKANAYDFGATTNIENSSNSYIIIQTNSETPTTNTIIVQENANVSVTLDGINISTNACAFAVAANSRVDLTLSGSNFLRSGLNRAGLEVPTDAELIISGSSIDTLTVMGGDYAAGIGGARNFSAGMITIEGGIITSSGGNAAGGTGSGAGIGGGRGGSGGAIIINGGDIITTGGYRAAGIGGGTGGSSGIILITDGDITSSAQSNSYSAGIGGGYEGKLDSITIGGGTIVATGDDGAGIGGGRIQNTPSTTDGGTINISGGAITATSVGGAGIGCGLVMSTTYVMPTTINITGGTIDASSYSDAGIGSNKGVINISNGHITSTSTGSGAGIGGRGNRTNGGTINISGGTIVAQGGATGGAGIGGGHNGNAEDAPGSIINISAGDITATGGPYSAGIGGGYGTTAGEITITGGIINAFGNGESAIGIGTIGWASTGGSGKITISKSIVNTSIDAGYSYYQHSINAGVNGTIHIGFTGDPLEWVCDDIDNRAEITFTSGSLSQNGLVLGTCLIGGSGEIDGSYIEGVKMVEPPFTGNGTTDDPYQITTATQLNQIRDYLDKSFVLMNDIDVNITPFNTGSGWDPIGTVDSPFTGSFDGNDYSISNLFIERTSTAGVGLFGYTNSAEMTNVVIDNANVIGFKHIGILAGSVTDSIVSSSYVSGAVSGTDTLDEVGGLIGTAFTTTISDCKSSVTVLGHKRVGGLVGILNQNSEILSCQSEGAVSATDWIGGLVGLNYGRISSSFSASNVTGNNYIGGLVGYNYWGGINEIIDSYARGSVTGNQYVGGLAGYNFYSTITNSYATGLVDGNIDTGGLVGLSDSGTITSSYYDSLTSSQADTGKGHPITTNEMKIQDTFIDWSFPNIWTLSSDNDGYPALFWQGYIHEELSDDATLSALSASGISFTPTFDGSITSYSANVSNNVSNTTIAAIASDSNATVQINGFGSTSREVTLNVGVNTFTIGVVAEDGISTRTYIMTINRASSGSSGSSSGSSYTPPPIIVTTEVNNSFTTNTTKLPSSTVSGTASANLTTAIVDALLNKIGSDGGSQKNDLIELDIDTKAGIDDLRISILQKDLEEIVEETDSDLGITSPFISIIFDAKALETISEADTGSSVVISAGIIDNSSLSESDQAKIKDRPVYDLNVMNGDTKVSNFNGGHATVSIPYTLQPDENPNAIVIYHLTDDGILKPIRGRYDAALKSVVFKTTHFSHFVISYNLVGFEDVAAGAWYKNAVDFIAARGITSGIGEKQYGPEAKLTRAQFIVLLMNAYQINTEDLESFTQMQNFTDAGNTYYTDYLMAAKSLGIVKGIGDNLFAPDKNITRQEMFVMLHNALKVIDEVPATTVDKEISSFDDVDQIADWALYALSDLVKSGIASGSSNNVYPTSGTTRAEIAQVLYNLLSK
ncbi:MAG: S-layer homology domain-containing protein [Dethiosulfatibacter sp.]|nr:S-layer homology domain-containing protein [Dethiosulfatibacter sp.]